MHIPSRLRPRLLLLVALATALMVRAFGAAVETGSISGRIFNPVTGEYVRNAEGSIRGTALATVSADDGSYRFAGVPAGEALVTVNYTGYAAAAASVTVNPGQNSARDIELVSGLAGAAGTSGRKEEILSRNDSVGSRWNATSGRVFPANTAPTAPGGRRPPFSPRRYE